MRRSCSNSHLIRAAWVCLNLTLPASDLWTSAWANPVALPGRPAVPDRGYLGVTLTEICPEVRAQTRLKEGEGLMIGRVAPNSPAAASGLLHYDIITRFGDQWIMSPAQFVTLVENAGPGAEVEITYLRRSLEVKSKVKLGRIPETPVTAATVPPLPEEMLTSVIRTLRDNPAALVAVFRMLHGNPSHGMEAPSDGLLNQGYRISLREEDGEEVELTIIGSSQRIKAWDKEGKLMFDGPCQTPEDLDALPPGLKPRVERLQLEFRGPSRRHHLPVPGKVPEKAQESLGVPP